MKYYQRGQKIDSASHNIGNSPNMKALNHSRENLLHHTTYNRQRELLNFSGTPERRFSPSGNINGDFDCSFYIIFPIRGDTGDKIRIGYSLSTWKYNDATGNCNFQWDGVASDKLADTESILSITQITSVFTDGDNPVPEGISVNDDIELDYDHNDFTGYGYTKVSFENLTPASFVSWITPIHQSDYNAIDPVYGSQAFHLAESAFNIDQTLRGSSANDDSNGSVGTLCQRQFDDDADGQNMVSNSDLCLFQWGHPSGLYVTSSSSTLTDVDMFGYNIKIKGRELLESGSGLLDVCMVYRADAGTTFKLTVDSTGTTHTNGNPNRATPYAEVVFSDIPFDGSGDDLTFEANVSSSFDIEIQNISIFEKTY